MSEKRISDRAGATVRKDSAVVFVFGHEPYRGVVTKVTPSQDGESFEIECVGYDISKKENIVRGIRAPHVGNGQYKAYGLLVLSS